MVNDRSAKNAKLKTYLPPPLPSVPSQVEKNCDFFVVSALLSAHIERIIGSGLRNFKVFHV